MYRNGWNVQLAAKAKHFSKCLASKRRTLPSGFWALQVCEICPKNSDTNRNELYRNQFNKRFTFIWAHACYCNVQTPLKYGAHFSRRFSARRIPLLCLASNLISLSRSQMQTGYMYKMN
jgi:hypothetical protein